MSSAQEAVATAHGRGLRVEVSLAAMPLVAVIVLLGARIAFATFDAESLVASSDFRVMSAAMAAGATLPVAIFLTIRAQYEDRVSNVVLAAALLIVSTLVFGVGDVGHAVRADIDAATLDAFRISGLVAAFGLAAIGLWDSRTGISSLWPMLIPLAVVGSALGLGIPATVLDAESLTSMGWAALVVSFAIAYLRARRPRHLWISVGFFGYFLAAVPPHLEPAPAGLLRTAASLVMLVGLAAAGERANRRRSATLESTELEILELREAASAAQQRQEERDHAARTALAAIEFTAHAMRRAGSLAPSAVEKLERALLSELELLRRLVTLPDPAGESRPYRLRDAIDGVVQAKRALGLEIFLDVPGDLIGVGHDHAVAELLQNLLENARRHARGSPVWIAARLRPPWLIIHVDDAGPGIEPGRRRDVFLRGGNGGHATSAEGRGLGLFIADRLAREQRGHIWIATANAGGASLRIALPAAESEVSDEGLGGQRPASRARRRVETTTG